MGRPVKSRVRNQLAEILFIAGALTAYDAHKHYIQLFNGVTQRNIYYQLKRGVDLGIFRISNIVEEQGEYSWGPTTRKVYYELTPAASPQLNTQVKLYFDDISKD